MDNSQECKESVSIREETLEGVFIKKWDSLADVHEELGYQQSLLSGCINKKMRQAYGFLWFKEDASIEDEVKRKGSFPI